MKNDIHFNAEVNNSNIAYQNDGKMIVQNMSTNSEYDKIFGDLRDFINNNKELTNQEKTEALGDLANVSEAVDCQKKSRARTLFGLLPDVIKTCDAGIKLLTTVLSTS
ncbi:MULTISPECIES: hypothetical protein [Listeria]|uniref:hypothetical protein n=1 Tax=Listeria TaxID=1637 RepID=UPI000F5ECF07|nr:MULTISPECIES: hypothetical protein [Listeria]